MDTLITNTSYVCKFVALVFDNSEGCQDAKHQLSQYILHRDFNDASIVKCHADLVDELLDSTDKMLSNGKLYCGTVSYGLWPRPNGQSVLGFGLETNGPPDVVRDDVSLSGYLIYQIVSEACGEDIALSSIVNMFQYC